MNENLNLVEILKDCPMGTTLYSTIHGEVKFSHIDKDDAYPIVLIHSDIDCEYVDSFGKHLTEHNGECTLFPSKDERDWSKFIVFKDGDILSSGNTCFIFNGYFDNGLPCAHGGIDSFGHFFKPDYKNSQWTSGFISYATDSEKLKLLIKMQECGYFWNNETKTIDEIKKDLEIGSPVMVSYYGDQWLLANYNGDKTITYKLKSGETISCPEYIVPVEDFDFTKSFKENINKSIV